ncbi:MAG: hypothetical protein ACE5HE_00510 [Phycisphaerae bacterium]
MHSCARTSRGALWAVLIVAPVVSAGCGGVTVLLGGGRPYDAYYYDDFYYYNDPYSYYDGYWYYDDYWYEYDDYFFVDYIDGWYYDSYYGCYYCKTIDDLGTGVLEEPVGWDVRWGPWEEFVRARVDFLGAKEAQGTSNLQVLPGERSSLMSRR